MQARLAIAGGAPAIPAGAARQWPEITPADKAAVQAVLDRQVLYGNGPEVRGLEAEWSAYTGSSHTIAVDSCTAAIHLALAILGVGLGDEVITTAFTFSGTVHPILYCGATPVFVDIDPRTYNMDVRQVEAKITPRTRAILPVHLHGLPADMDALLALRERYGLPIVEDACQAHGATYGGQQVGTLGDIGCFSLNPAKTLVGGQGGLLTTQDAALAERAARLRVYGERRDETPRTYTSYEVGFSYGMQEMSAALARSQLRRLDDYNARAQRNAARLTAGLAGPAGVIPPEVPADRTCIFHKYRLRFDWDALAPRCELPPAQKRDRLFAALAAEGVSVALWQVVPVPAYPLFQPYRTPDGHSITYQLEEYQETQRLLDSSIVIGDEKHPLCVQDSTLMDSYVEAFHKVFTQLEEIFHD